MYTWKNKGSLSAYVDELLFQAHFGDPTMEIQSKIHPDLNFMRNSVNILIGNRGSGKTFNVFREVMKAQQLDLVNEVFHLFIYVTDKRDDSTYKKMKQYLRLPVWKVSYRDINQLLHELADAKAEYTQGYETNWEEYTSEEKDGLINQLCLTDDSKKNIQTIILLDDCRQILNERRTKKEPRILLDWLLENRQPKFTFFLTLHELFALKPDLKANVDSIWIFGGYPHERMRRIFDQLNVEMSKDSFHREYGKLTKRQAFIMEYTDDGTQVFILKR